MNGTRESADTSRPAASRPPPFVIPVFIAHQGCPHCCVFCNQRSITGAEARFCQKVTGVAVAEEIRHCLARPRRHAGREVQVAFYGGSFTGLSPDRQQELLGAVRPFLEQGRVDCIRLSTRPDYVDRQTSSFLRAGGVKTVELGVQAMDPVVLAASNRGHTVEQTEAAITFLKEGGMTVGGQLMLGLPEETTRSVLAGAQRLARLRPDFVRIYPALVIKGSELAQWYAAGRYRPLSLNRAVALTARMKDIFDHHRIRVVRMGLQPSVALENDLVAGPYHPAFGELVLSRLFFKRLRKELAQSPAAPQNKTVSIAAADQSILRGVRNSSIRRLTALGLLENVRFRFDAEQPRGSIMAVKESDF